MTPITSKTCDVISYLIYIIQNLLYLWNEKRYQQKENTIFLRFKRPFIWAQFVFYQFVFRKIIAVMYSTLSRWENKAWKKSALDKYMNFIFAIFTLSGRVGRVGRRKACWGGFWGTPLSKFTVTIIFSTALVDYITAMIYYLFKMLFRSSNTWISYIHFISPPSTGILQTHKWPAPSWQLASRIAQVVIGLHRYRRGHGFDSRPSLNFFQALFSQLPKSST